MRLKSLEIKGFKSFGDRVLIHFDEGVTGIVGPNGCGKSNVVDSIRWVLGEQKTRALRSDKMENVIFNGTKNRKQAHLAEVSLLFENTKNLLPTEYTEVKITRKLYRTGDSEYQINGVNCRLKDIHTLFMDTGVGSDSYAIMELGMIDDILNDKENSRRHLFEEASGVSKYKQRKKETLSKLKSTEEDLDRVQDLLFEIEKNMKSLQAQAKKTERYYKLREEYKIYSLELAAWMLRDFNEGLESKAAQIEAKQDGIVNAETKIREGEAASEKAKLEIVHKEKILATRQKATNEKLDAIRAYENEKNLHNQKLSMLGDKEENLRKRLDEDKTFLTQLAGELDKLGAQTADKEAETTTASQVADEAKLKNEASREALNSARQQAETLRKSSAEARDKLHKIEKELAVTRIQVQSLEQEIDRNTTEAKSREEELDKFSLELDQVQSLKETQEALIEKLKKEEEDLNARIDQLQKQLEKNRAETSEIGRKLDAKRNEFNLTKSLVDNMEGYPDSLKFLKKNAEWAKSAQLLSDLISCKNDLKAVIENYLEPFLNYYVVETLDEAVNGVGLLSQSSKGRANFFVNTLFATHKQHELLLIPNAVSALTVVDSDPKYFNLINFLLGNVYVLEVPAGSDEEAYLADYRNRFPDAVFLTQNGKFSVTRFSLSGGSIGLFEGKRLGRKRNLESLSKDIAELETQLREQQALGVRFNEGLAEARQSNVRQRLNEAQSEMNRIIQQFNLLSTRQEQHAAFIKSQATRREEIEKKLNDFKSQIERDEPILAQLQVDAEQLAADWHAENEKVQQLTEQQQRDQQHFNASNTHFLQVQNALTVLKRDLEFNTNQRTVVENRIQRNEAEYAQTKEELSGLLNNTDHSDETLVEMYREKEAMDAAVAEAEEDLLKSKNFLSEVEDGIRVVRNQKDDILAEIQLIKDELTNIQVKKSGLAERLGVEFKLDAAELEDLKPTIDSDDDDLKKKVTEFKQRLDNFGEINPLAVEAYNEINERFTFISEQRDDLLKSKKSLLDTIAEIDENAREKFMSAFNTIRDNFQRVFRTLFTEDDACDLLLVNPNEPLESLINITARPKGKRPLTINQLSGGEKTLTAIALLFAIYLYKPAPFCIFDEVDAPLDDVNIDKFNRIIREFSAQSQFIIVTHNKRTMETTDVMYGITMIEQGVSRVVPVDLRQTQLT